MRILENRYRVIRELGSGGMGKVLLAENRSLGTLWAIKVVEKKSSSFDLLAEPNILKRLNHPALPRIVDIEQDDQHLYIIEDYIAGTSLDRQLSSQKSFGEGTVLEWAKQLCEVLLYLHGQQPHPIIYRDMKPANIIVGDDNRIKLIDFGIAREYKTQSESDTTYMGTRGYAAPEQYGTAQSDERTDIYSLGVTLYHLLTGKHPNEPPYEFKRLRTIDPGFSEGLDHIINTCVQTDPDSRYQSADELLRDLANIHLFNSAYRRKVRLEKVMSTLKMAMIVAFAMLTIAGWNRMGLEKQEKYERLMVEGNTALASQQFELAEQSFKKAAQVFPGRPAAYLGTAQTFLKRGDYEESIAYLDWLSSQLRDIHHSDAYNYILGTAYYENGSYQDAVFYLRRAAQAAPSKAVYVQDLAVSLAKLGELAEARQLLDQISYLEGRDDVFDFVNAQVLLAEGKKAAAIDAFTRSLSVTKDELVKKRSYLELAAIYKADRNRSSSALSKQIAILEQANAELLHGKDIAVTEMLAEAYHASRQYVKSIEAFQSLLDLGYHRPYIYANIAIIQQQRNDFAAAEATLRAMISRFPQDYTAYLRLALLQIETEGRKAEAQRNYQKVLENYNTAVRLSPAGEATADLLPLRNLINELRSKGWLK